MSSIVRLPLGRASNAGFMLIFGLSSGAAHAGDCPDDVHPEATLIQVNKLLDAAEGVIDVDAPKKLNQRMGPVRLEVGCLAEVLTPELSAKIHRLRAIQADPLGMALQKPEVLGALSAARVLEPSFDLTTLLPPEHGLVAAYSILSGTAPETEKLVKPQAGALAFDGTISQHRPIHMATLYQRLDDTGVVVETAWLAPQTPLPAYPERQTKRIGLWVASGGFAATGVALLGGAMASEARFNDPDNGLNLDELDGLRGKTNALFFTGMGLTVLAGGSATTAVIVGAQ